MLYDLHHGKNMFLFPSIYFVMCLSQGRYLFDSTRDQHHSNSSKGLAVGRSSKYVDLRDDGFTPTLVETHVPQ